MAETATAVVLLSGGLDSATVLAMALADGHSVQALTMRYGQRHAAEIAAATRIARQAGVAKHAIADIDLRVFGGSALTSDIPVPKGDAAAPAADGIPITYVPARNTIFLAYALACAESIGADDIYIGVNAVDYSGYPDCRPEFIAAFQRLAALATRAGVEGRAPRIRAPLLHLSKHEIIERGLALGVDYSLTVSCYDPSPSGEACGECDACRLRLAGFAAAGIDDPAPYVSSLSTRHPGRGRSEKA